MTWAAESAKAEKRPLTVVELDLDYCSNTYATGADVVSHINRNLLRKSEILTDWASVNVTVAADAMTPPTGMDQTYKLTETVAAGTNLISMALEASVLEDNEQYVLSAHFKVGTTAGCTLMLRDNTVGTARVEIDYQWTGAVLSVKAQDTGTGSVESLGDGWYRALAVVPAGTIVGANSHTARLYPSENGVVDTNFIYATGVMIHKGTASAEYQVTNDRATWTNFTLTTGGLTVDAEIGNYIQFTNGGTEYQITDNGTEYVRVNTDLTGSVSVTDDIFIGAQNAICTANAGSGSECYNAYAACQATSDYVKTTKTYRFCTDGCTANEQITADAIPSVTSANPAPAVMAIGEGLGQRAGVTVTLQDHPHHDRGVDPYVSTRSYTPETQGTYWTKLRARNPYYQSRPMRIKVGYIASSGLDLTNDFKTHNYIIERMSGPTSRGTVTITGKDILKLADDKRAQAPDTNSGVLTAAYTSGDGSFTLSPSGIGNDEYSASGTLRIGSELMTFTRVADAVTVTGEGQSGTEAANHAAGETVQECLVYSAESVDDVIYDLLVNYAGVTSSYIDTSAWLSEVTDWLSTHSVDAIITEPTGVRTLLDELCRVFMISLWWDDETQKIDMKVLAPSTTTFDAYTDSTGLAEDSVDVNDDPEQRLSQVWVYYDILDPTRDLEEVSNYSTVYAYLDTAAESSVEYGESRVKKMFSRWFASSADAIRLAQRTLLRFRDNPRMIQFTLGAENHYQPGDVVELTSDKIVDETGASTATKVEILEASDPQIGHARRYRGEEYAFNGSYMRIAANGTPDWGSATAAQKLIAGWICANGGTYESDGTPGYKIV